TYYLAGTTRFYYDPVAATGGAWPITAGSPPDGGRLLCTWRGRLVVSGVNTDPQNWFMSKQLDPTNWDYSPAVITESQAVAGNNSLAGYVGDVINTMIPWSDDVLIFGGNQSLFQMTGDPMAGGRIDRISDTVGLARGR